MTNIAIIGAGITGVLSAYFLAKEGYKVTVFEQERYSAMRTSFANGGQLSVSNSEVWTTWSNVQKGIGWMFTKDAPLLIRPKPNLDKIVWLSKFLYHTAKSTSKENTIKSIELGLQSRPLYEKIIKEENIKFDYSQCGILHIYKDQEYYNNACAIKTLYNDNGCDWEILEKTQTLSIDPALMNITNIIGGAYTKTDSVGDIHKFCIELTTVLKNKYNVEFFYNSQIDKSMMAVLLQQYDKIVISAGVGSTKLAKIIGDSLSIYPVKGYSITINVKSDQLKYMPQVSLLDDKAKIVTSTLGNRFRVAGTAELDGENYDIRRDRIEPLLNWVSTNFPRLDINDYSSWACLRPMTPNMMPIIDKSNRNSKIYYHTGHGHLGWTYSPATAILLKDMIKNEG